MKKFILLLVILVLFIKINIAHDNPFQTDVKEPPIDEALQWIPHSTLGVVITYSDVEFAHPIMGQSLSANYSCDKMIYENNHLMLYSSGSKAIYRFILGPATMYRVIPALEWQTLIKKTH